MSRVQYSKAVSRSTFGTYPSSSPTNHLVRSQFSNEWRTQDDPPTAEKIYEITISRDVRAKHDAYGYDVRIVQDSSLTCAPHRTKHPSLKEIRTFHSSQCICDLGSKEAALCNFKACGICNIVKSSFKAFAFAVPYNTGRYAFLKFR